MADNTTNSTLPPVTDVRSAAAHFAGLLDLSGNVDSRDDTDTEDNESTADDSADEVELEADDDGAQDDLASDDETTDDEKDEPEPQALAIEPPKSWSADDAAEFKNLSPKAQEIILRRESERDKAINQRMQQIAEERKAVEAHIQKANQVQNDYAKTLNQLITLTIPEIQKVENVDWIKLSQDDPAECVRLSAVRDNLRQRVGFMQHEMQQMEQHQLAQQQQQQQERLASQYEQLIETVPEFKEPVKAKALVHDIGSTMSNYGFTAEEIGGVADARIVRVMARLAQFEKLEAAKKSALGKKTGAPAPKLMSPNAAPAREDRAGKRIEEQYKALKRSGSAKDAARLFEQLL